MRLSSCVLRMLLCSQILAYQMFYIPPNSDVMLIMTSPLMIALSPDHLREPGDEDIVMIALRYMVRVVYTGLLCQPYWLASYEY